MASRRDLTILMNGLAAGEPAYTVVNATPSSHALRRLGSRGTSPRNGTPDASAMPRGPFPKAVNTWVCESANGKDAGEAAANRGLRGSARGFVHARPGCLFLPNEIFVSSRARGQRGSCGDR